MPNVYPIDSYSKEKEVGLWINNKKLYQTDIKINTINAGQSFYDASTILEQLEKMVMIEGVGYVTSLNTYKSYSNKTSDPTVNFDKDTKYIEVTTTYNEITNNTISIYYIKSEQQVRRYIPSNEEPGDFHPVMDVYYNGVSTLDEDRIAQIKGYKELTQAEYDALPSSKTSDGIMYCIKDSSEHGTTTGVLDVLLDGSSVVDQYGIANLNGLATAMDLATKQNSLVAGDNITLTPLQDGTVRISSSNSTPGLQGVTVNGTSAPVVNYNAIITIPTRTSDLINDSNFVDSTYLTTNYYNKTGTDTKIATEIANIPDVTQFSSGHMSPTMLGTLNSAIQGVKVDNIALTPDINNTVNINLAGKQNVLTAGTGIQIASDVISATPMTGAQAGSNGAAGMVPAPTIQDLGKFLSADGSWAAVSGGTTDYTALSNLPSINNVTLTGNKTTSDLGFGDLASIDIDGASSTKFLRGDGTWATIHIPSSGVQDVEVNGTSVVNASGVAEIDLTGYAETANLATVATSGDYTDLNNTPNLATVATTGDYTDLSNTPTIPAAQIQSDWSQTDNTQLDFIKNKPTIPSAQIQSDWNQSDNTQLDYIKNKPTIPAAQIQSDWNQSDNTKADFIKNKPTIPDELADLSDDSTHRLVTDTQISQWNAAEANVQSDWNQSTTTADDYIKNKPTLGTAAAKNVGVANGVAELDSDGKVPSSQLPSYVDDVLEYASTSAFPATGESGKIYIALDTNKTYRWSGTSYVEISASLALGETSSTAYRGDRGKTAYNHATETKAGQTSSGLYKVASTAQGHIASLTAVEKADITALGIPAQDTTYTGTGLISINSNNVISTTAEANQNTFAKVKVGSTTITADAKQDTLELVAGDNITLTPDATNDKVTIAATDTQYSLPLAANGTRGGVQIGYTQSGKNYPVELSSEKMYVNVPWTDTNTKVTSAANHYTPATDASSALDVDASGGSAATWNSTNMVTGITISRDSKGHVTDLSVDSIKLPSNPNTDTKVTSVGNHYAPAEDSTAQLDADASGGSAATWNSTQLVTGVTVKRDAKGHVTGLGVDSIKLPANPNTDTKVTSSANHYTPSTASGQDKTASASGATAAWSIDVVKGVTLNTDGKGHVTGLSVTSGKIPGNPNTDTKVRQTLLTTQNVNKPLLMGYADITDTTGNVDNVSYRANGIYANPSTGNLHVTQLNEVTVGSSPKFTDTDTKVTSSANHYAPSTASGSDISADASGATAAWSIDVVKGVKLNTDGKGHVTGLSVTSGKIPANPNTNTIPSAYCDTAAGTAAKLASCTNYKLLSKSFIHVIVVNTNTSASAITLNINGQGAKPIYIDGAASSASNYNLPQGSYIAYYDGTRYYFRKDGKLPASISGNAETATQATKDGSGNTITSTYLKLSGGTMTGDIKFPAGKSIYSKDHESREYALIRDNGDNMWIGAASSTNPHHSGPNGNTYISAGYNTTNSDGNSTIYVSIPHLNDTTWSHTTYPVLHSGNYNNYVKLLKGMNTSGNTTSLTDQQPGDYNLNWKNKISSTTTGLFYGPNNANGVLQLNRHNGNYNSYLGFSSDGGLYYRSFDSLAVNTTKPWSQIAQEFKYFNASTSGTSKYIKVFINSTVNWMLSFQVSILGKYKQEVYQVSGYQYGTNHWSSPKATAIAMSDDTSRTVTFGYDADYQLWVAFPSNDYCSVNISNVVLGYKRVTDWSDLFRISIVDSLSGTTQTTKTVYRSVRKDETIPVNRGGTGSTTAAGARTNLGVSQAWQYDTTVTSTNWEYIDENWKECRVCIACWDNIVTSENYAVITLEATILKDTVERISNDTGRDIVRINIGDFGNMYSVIAFNASDNRWIILDALTYNGTALHSREYWKMYVYVRT